MTRLLSDKKQQYVSTRVREGLSRPLRHTPDIPGVGQSPLLSLTVPISWARAVEAHVSSDVICAELHPPDAAHSHPDHCPLAGLVRCTVVEMLK